MTIVEMTMSLQTHLIFKYYKDMIDVMVYLILLDQPVHLGEIVPMVEVEWKEKKENKDQEMGFWFLQDGEDFLVQIKQEHDYSIRGKLLKVITLTMEVELVTSVYLMSLSFLLTHKVPTLTIKRLSMEQNTRLVVAV